ncbi:MFS transporter [uncultured Bradyrhizobium sp.]|uniref:MFS transporter n=1 Tax=uncultured Bradyrhizobium sp. TaxID=199684 RepID=UPI0035C99DCE
MGLSLGIRQSQGLFMLPMAIDLGWSRESLGFAFAVQNLVWGITQPLAGIFADRFDSARVILVGVVVYALGLVAMANSHAVSEFTLSSGLLVGVGLSGTAFAVIYGAVGKIVPPDHRPWAIGAVGALGGLVQFLVVPLIQFLLDEFAWSRTFVILCVIFLALCPLAWFMRTRAALAPVEASEKSMGRSIADAFRNSSFWLLNLGFLACGFQLAFIAGHLPSYLIDQGMDLHVSGAAIALISLANVAGTFVFGYLGGSVFRRKYLLSFIYFARAAAMVLFLLVPLSPLTAYLFAATMGFLWLGTVPLTSGLVGQIFGARYVTTLFGFVFLGHQIGAFLGIWLAGAVFDATKSYSQIWWLSILLGVIAGLLHLPVNDKAVVRERSLEAVPT